MFILKKKWDEDIYIESFCGYFNPKQLGNWRLEKDKAIDSFPHHHPHPHPNNQLSSSFAPVPAVASDSYSY